MKRAVWRPFEGLFTRLSSCILTDGIAGFNGPPVALVETFLPAFAHHFLRFHSHRVAFLPGILRASIAIGGFFAGYSPRFCSFSILLPRSADTFPMAEMHVLHPLFHAGWRFMSAPSPLAWKAVEWMACCHPLRLPSQRAASAIVVRCVVLCTAVRFWGYSHGEGSAA